MPQQAQNLGLSFDVVSYTFGQGFDTKSDPNLLEAPHLRDLKNMVFSKTLGYTLRNGYTSIGSLGSGLALSSFKLNPLVVTNTNVQGYSSLLSAFQSRGSYDNFQTTFFNVSVEASTQQSVQTAASSNGMICTVWKDTVPGSSSTVRAKIQDTSGNLIKSEFSISSVAGSDSPKVFATSTAFVFLYHYNSGTDEIGFKSILLSDATLTLSAEIVLDQGTLPNGSYVSSTDKVLLTYVDSTNNHKGAYLSSAGALTASTTIDADGATITRTFCTSAVISSVLTNLFISTKGGIIRAVSTNSSMSSVFAARTVDNTTSNMDKGTAVFDGTNWRLYWEDKGGASEAAISFIKTTTITPSGTVGSLTTYVRNRTIAMAPFLLNGTIYLGALKQGTYLAYEFLSGATTARLVSTQSLGTAIGSDSVVNAVSSGNSHFFPNITTRAGFRDSSYNLLPQVAMYCLTTGATVTSQDSSLGTFISGPHTYVYDGNIAYEAGLPIPDDVVSVNVASAGNMTGTYLLAYTFSFVNALGQLVESAPSNPKSITVASKEAILTLRTLKLTDRPTNSIQINVYSTVASGTTYYLVGSTNNDPTNDTLTFTANLTDAAVALQAQAYFNTDVFNNAPPIASCIRSFGDRMLYLGLPESPKSFAFSKGGEPESVPAEFLETLPLQNSESIVAGAALDASFVLLTTSSVYILQGAGPDDTGNNSDYTITRVQSDVGCIDPRTVCETNAGVFFNSNRGICFIDRAFNMFFIGAPAEFYSKSYQITSATTYGENQEVRFATSGEYVLDCNYSLFNPRATYNAARAEDHGVRWTAFTGFNAVSVRVVNDCFYHLTSAGAVYRENKAGTNSDFNDNGKPIRATIVVPWLKPGDKNQMVKRVRRVAILGSNSTAALIALGVQLNYANGCNEYVSNQPEVQQAYGQGLFGVGSYGQPGVVLLRHRLTTQKCQAVSFEIQATCLNQNFSFSGIDLEVGLKQGLKAGVSV